MCRKIYLYFNDLIKAKRDVDPNEENKCVMVLPIWNKRILKPIFERDLFEMMMMMMIPLLKCQKL